MLKVVLTLSFGFLACVGLQAQSSYNALVYAGNKAYKKNDFSQSNSHYLDAVKKDEKNFVGHFNLGNSLYKNKQYEEAQAEFEKASHLATDVKDKSAALYNLGNTYMQTQQTEKAAEYYKQSLKNDPFNEATRKNYEIAKLKLKEEKEKQGGASQDSPNKPNSKSGGQPKEGKDGEGKDREQNGKGNGEDEKSNTLSKQQQEAILRKVSEKEKQTARRILNKNAYSMPESNEKDW